MGKRGRLTEWNDDRGFGFVTPLDGGPSAFVHVSEFPRELRRPQLNDLVAYCESRDERNRLRATDVAFLAPAHAKQGGPVAGDSLLVPLAVSGAFFVVLCFAVALRGVPALTPVVCLIMSLVLYAMYAADKAAAQAGRWRTSEASLHLVALLGGWPGGLLAQHLLRHKTRKQPFRAVFWVTVGLNCMALIGVAYVQAAAFPS